MVQRSLIKRVEKLERLIALAAESAMERLIEMFWLSFSEQDREVLEQLEQRFGFLGEVEREGLSEAEAEVYARFLEKQAEFLNKAQEPALIMPIWADRMGKAFK